jgi:hypothetical protein
MAHDGGACSRFAIVVSAGALACGDPRDVHVPLIPEVDPSRLVPTFALAPTRAFAIVNIRGLPDAGAAGCPFAYTIALGESCDRIGAEGTCQALRDEADGVAQCALRPRLDAPGAFDVELLIEHDLLPRLTVVGRLGESTMARVQLHASTPERAFDAECDAEVISITATTVQVQVDSCSGRVDGVTLPSCVAAVTVGFENCRP